MALQPQFDVQRMQQDAERRMREMKKRADVYIGNSETKVINGKMVTPRGYRNV